MDAYGVAIMSRLLKIIGLFCKRALSKRLYSAKQTYDFHEPTTYSHPILIHELYHADFYSVKPLKLFSFSEVQIAKARASDQVRIVEEVRCVSLCLPPSSPSLPSLLLSPFLSLALPFLVSVFLCLSRFPRRKLLKCIRVTESGLSKRCIYVCVRLLWGGYD